MSYTHIIEKERYVISHMKIAGFSLRAIGRRLGRHHTSIRREIDRNRPTYADDAVYWYYATQKIADELLIPVLTPIAPYVPGLNKWIPAIADDVWGTGQPGFSAMPFNRGNKKEPIDPNHPSFDNYNPPTNNRGCNGK